MPSQTDPTRSWRARARLTWLVTAAAAAACAVWALRSLPRETGGVPETLGASAARTAVMDAARPDDGFTRAAFRAALWAVPPQHADVAEAAKPPPPPPPPLKLQLIAILATADAVTGEVLLRAALYDPDTDSLTNSREGERAGVYTVVSVTRVGVELADGRGGRRALALDPDPGKPVTPWTGDTP